MSNLEQLSDEQRTQYEAIAREVQRFVDDDLYHQGIERLDLILGGVPDDTDWKLFRGALYGKRAEFLLELEDDEGAWRDAQKAMNGGWYDAVVHGIAGWAMFNMDDLDRAREQFDLSLDLDPRRIPALMGRALVYMELDELDLARGDLSTALQVDSHNPAAYSLRAEVDLALGANESARRDIEKARRLDPSDSDIALLHARLAAVNADFRTALDALSDAIDDEEASLEALLLRSHIRLSQGELDGAKKDAIRASNNYADEAFAFVQLANVQLSAGSSALALKAAERAVGLDPSLPDGYLARAAALRIAGREEEAQKDFERASSEPVELPYFLLGPAFEALDGDEFHSVLTELLHNSGTTDQAARATQEAAESMAQGKGMPSNPFAALGGLGGGLGGLGGLGGMGGMDPSRMLDQLFDQDGNIKPALKPLLKMAMRNAPAMMKNMPDSMLESQGLDRETLESMDMSNISEEQLEEQMRLFYKMMKNKDS